MVGGIALADESAGMDYRDKMLELCRFWHAREVCSSSSIRRKRWSECCDQSMEAGARQAHGYMKDRIAPQ
eukprot:5126068-Pyramimonas_sp.AAC.1